MTFGQTRTTLTNNFFINNSNSGLTSIFQDNLGKQEPECHLSGFYRSKDDGDGADMQSFRHCVTTNKGRADP